MPAYPMEAAASSSAACYRRLYILTLWRWTPITLFYKRNNSRVDIPCEYQLILYVRKRRFVADWGSARYGQLEQEKASTCIVTHATISLFLPSPCLRQARVQDKNLGLEDRKDRLAFSSTEDLWRRFSRLESALSKLRSRSDDKKATKHGEVP